MVTNELIKETVKKIENDYSKLLSRREIEIVIHYLDAGMSPRCVEYACYVSWVQRYGRLDMKYAEHVLFNWLKQGFTTYEDAKTYVESTKE